MILLQYVEVEIQETNVGSHLEGRRSPRPREPVEYAGDANSDVPVVSMGGPTIRSTPLTVLHGPVFRGIVEPEARRFHRD